MKMYNKSQTSGIPNLLLALLVAGFIFFIGMGIINILKPEITTARNNNNLDCSSSTISDGNKVTCLLIDIVIPYVFIIIVAAAGGIITARFIQG